VLRVRTQGFVWEHRKCSWPPFFFKFSSRTHLFLDLLSLELQRTDPEPRTRERRCSTHFTAGPPSNKGVISIQMGQVKMNTSPAHTVPVEKFTIGEPPWAPKATSPLSHSFSLRSHSFSLRSHTSFYDPTAIRTLVLARGNGTMKRPVPGCVRI